MKYLLILLIFTLSASARYNETEKQCTERYGKAHLSHKYNDRAFSKTYKVKTISIQCYFLDGKCYKIYYREDHLGKFLNTLDILKLYGITKVKVPVFKDGTALNRWNSKIIKDFYLRGAERFLEITNLKLEAKFKESQKSKTGNVDGL